MAIPCLLCSPMSVCLDIYRASLLLQNYFCPRGTIVSYGRIPLSYTVFQKTLLVVSIRATMKLHNAPKFLQKPTNVGQNALERKAGHFISQQGVV